MGRGRAQDAGNTWSGPAHLVPLLQQVVLQVARPLHWAGPPGLSGELRGGMIQNQICPGHGVQCDHQSNISPTMPWPVAVPGPCWNIQHAAALQHPLLGAVRGWGRSPIDGDAGETVERAAVGCWAAANSVWLHRARPERTSTVHHAAAGKADQELVAMAASQNRMKQKTRRTHGVMNPTASPSIAPLSLSPPRRGSLSFSSVPCSNLPMRVGAEAHIFPTSHTNPCDADTFLNTGPHEPHTLNISCCNTSTPPPPPPQITQYS